MADVKISALPASSTPLAGTEILPIVQSSTTRQVSVANLTAGRAVNALSITASSLTSGRVTYAGTAGLLQDSANLTFNGTTLTANTIGAYTLSGTIAGGGNQINNVIIGTSTPLAGSFTTINASTSITNAGLTSGRVTYAGTAGLLQDDADFTFNGTTVTMANDASISGLTVGKGAGAVASNTVIGGSALATNTSGSSNTVVGFQAANRNVSGTNNSVFGYNAGYWMTGSFNTGVGDSSLGTNNAAGTGSNNVAVGYQSLFNNIASSNTAVGYQTGFSNTTGNLNSYFGYQAGYTLQTGGACSAFGYQALKNNTGANNNAYGSEALVTNTSGANNNAFGVGALALNLTGSNQVAVGHSALNANSSGNSNTAVGYQALIANTTASSNTAVGYQALFTKTTGDFNVAIGYQAGLNMLTGQRNTLVGTTAGSSLTTGSNNTFIGCLDSTGGNAAGAAITTGSKNSILGNYTGNNGGLDIRTASNYIVLSDGDGNPRGIFDNSGNFLVGTTTAVGKITLEYNGASVVGQNINDSADTSNSTLMQFLIQGTQVGTIKRVASTSAVVYNTTSDYRLKTVTGAVTGQGLRIDALKPIDYVWTEGGQQARGFLAHEFQTIYPNSVSGEKDVVDANGKPVYQGMQASTAEVIADLVAEIQSLRKRLTVLESK